MAAKQDSPVEGLLDPRSERSRAAILTAALELIVEDGWASVTQQSVAERAGVGRATVYRHWPERVELVRDALALASQTLVIQAPTSDDLRSRLLELVHIIVGPLADEGLGQLLAAMIDLAERDPQVRATFTALVAEASDPLRQALRDGIRDGQLQDDTDLDLAFAQLIGPGLYRRLLDGRSVDRRWSRQVVDDFLTAHGTDGEVRSGGRRPPRRDLASGAS